MNLLTCLMNHDEPPRAKEKMGLTPQTNRKGIYSSASNTCSLVPSHEREHIYPTNTNKHVSGERQNLKLHPSGAAGK